VPHDTQIFVGKNRDGNSDYDIPSGAEILVLAVNANFADSGAGTDWLPAVVMFSDSGSVIARALLPDVKVTAGDDAEVSWFPGVKPGGGGTTGLSAISVSFDIGAGAFGAGTTTLPIQAFSTNDASLFSVPDPTNGLIDINEDCSLLAVGQLAFNPPFDLQGNTVLEVLGAPATGFSHDIAVVPADAANITHVAFLTGSTLLAVFAGDFSGLALVLDDPIANVTGAGLALIKLTDAQLF
jgi:hypothetical protein